MSISTILQMSAATLGYVLVTAVLWVFYSKKEQCKLPVKILIGLVYGACSVAANHFGIVQSDILILNVRDIGPLAAGLFFSPLSGIIAGFIGGAERILAGELWGLGTFTEIACGISTFLAGVLSAFLHHAVFRGKRPPVIQSFIIGAVMEVFHMYAILFTHHDTMTMAYYIVQEVSVPMIVFTSIGLALCSMVIRKLSGEKSDMGFKTPEERIPVTVLFQRSLLIVTIGLFIFNFIVSYNLQTRLVNENVTSSLFIITSEKETIYEQNHSLDELKKNLAENSDPENYYLLVTKDGVIESIADETNFTDKLLPEDLALIRENVGEYASLVNLKTFDNEAVYAQFAAIGPDHYLVVCRDMYTVYFQRDSQIYENTLSDILLFAVFFMLVAMVVDRLVVRNLHRVNQSLHKITEGNLNETVWVHTSEEFTALSEDINHTVTALRGYIDAAEQRMKEELSLAAAIQDSALPKNFSLPDEHVEIYALMTPARQVGGDFYDFFYIGHDRLCLVIADVSGKGIPASLFMMRAKTAIKNNAQSSISASEVLTHVNQSLCEGNDAGMFVSVWIGILSLKTGVMQCANAGHEYPVLMRAGGQYELLKDKHGLVLAAMDGIKIPGYEIQMNPGDRIFVYTDGVPEAINEKEEAYGTDRLTSRLNRVRYNTQEYILKDILQDIRNFAGSAEQFDDITMLGLTFQQPSDYTQLDASVADSEKNERS